LRKKHIAAGDNPLHPSFRYSSWDAFVAAGKPWHNHGERQFHNMTWGDRSLAWEARRREPRYDPIREHERLQEMGIVPVVDYRHRVRPFEPARQSADIIPAGVRLQMLADANGGLGPIGLTPGSPESSIRSYLESVDRNGFKPPGNIRLA
ncbi:MAG: hypothetical protein ACO3QC_08535, partial [Phycisphaerales bacterium]